MGGYIREGFKHEWYLRYALLDQERTAQTTAAFIAAMIEDGSPIDAIAFTGMSGALVAPRVASLLDLPMLMVRKAYDGSHSAYGVEGFVESQCYVIVDDFVCTGTTVGRICESIAATHLFLPKHALCVGTVQYNELMDNAPERAWTGKGVPENLLGFEL